MNANNERCLGENSYKRNSDWDRKRRIVVNVEEPQKHIDFSEGGYDLTPYENLGYDLIPYENLPIAPGLPDIVQDVGASHELGGGYHKRDTCANVRKYDGKQGEVSFDLSKIGEVSRRRPGRDTCANVRNYDGKRGEVSFDLSKIDEIELEDDGLAGIETYFPDFESFNAYFPDFTAFNYKAETFNENDWPEFDVIE